MNIGAAAGSSQSQRQQSRHNGEQKERMNVRETKTATDKTRQARQGEPCCDVFAFDRPCVACLAL